MSSASDRRSPRGPHARARALAASRLDGPLDPASATWLDSHLSSCDACRAAADDYEADRILLIGAAVPIPPRDLWARTAARLDRERGGRRRRWRRPWFGAAPIGALAGVLVVAVVLGASYLNQRAPVPGIPAHSAAAAASSPIRTLTARATPIAIDAQVGLVQADTDGKLGILTANVDEVCASGSGDQCEADTNGSRAAIGVTEHPKSVVQSPNGKQLAVVLEPGEPGGIVIVAAPSNAAPASGAPTTSPTSTPVASTSPSAAESATPSGSPSAVATAAPSDGAVASSASPSTASPAASPTSSDRSSAAPSGTPSPSALPSPSASSSTSSPSPTVSSTASQPAPSPRPSSTPTVSPSASAPLVLPSASPVATPMSIAADVTIVGQSAAYSTSGDWFAFSARPRDGSHGPDVYVWHVGDPRAHPVTNDHRSVFSTWIGNSVLGSRAEPLGGTRVEARTVSFLLDPASGASRVVPGDGIWRPVVDPTGKFAVYWSGTIAVDADGLEWRPANGTLVLARWDPSQLVAPGSSAASAHPGASQTPQPSGSPGAPVALLAPRPVADWDARWDESGTYLGLWLADGPGRPSGRLALHTVDGRSGALDTAGAVFDDQPAQPGFAIGRGRLAWVAPGGERGSVVKVYAWAGSKGGTAQTVVQPGDTLVVR